MSGRLQFHLLLLAAAIYFAWSALGYEPQARQIPLLVGGIVLLLQALVTIREAIHAEAAAATDGAETSPPPHEGRRVAEIGGWMLLFFLLLVVLGTLLAIFLFILLFLLAQQDVGWRRAFTIATAMTAAVWLLFASLMRFDLYPGLLFGGDLPPI